MKKRSQFAIWIFCICLLTFSFYQTRAVDFQKLERIFGVIQLIRESDTALDQDILKSRYYIIKSYDPLNTSISQIQTSLNELRSDELALLKIAEGNEDIKIAFDKYAEVFSFRKILIDKFKSQNAILKNSLYYLPLSAMTSKSLSSGGYSLLVDDIVRETLLYTNSGDEENKKLAEASIVKLKKLNELSTGQLKSEAEVFIKHSENILTRKKDLDNIVKDIINLPTKDAINLLYYATTGFYNRFLNQANLYRLILYNLSIGMLLYIALAIIKLKIASVAMQNLNQSLIRLNSAFARFVPHDFLNILDKKNILEIQLGDHVKEEMTVLFSDIRGFTSLSESMTPEDNFRFINSYLGTMGPIVRNNKGFIDKFIGDAIMALFKGESENAIDAAVEMLEGLEKYNTEHRTGRSKVQIGIGLHRGEMMLGTIGENNRMEGTVISDSVNLAARIEGMTKMYGIPLLISDKVFDTIKDKEKYNYRKVDTVVVKGKAIPVTVYEIFNSDPVALRALKDKLKPNFEKAVELYYAQDFLQARALLESHLKEFPNDKPAILHLERCFDMIENPLKANTQGASVLNSK